MGYIDLNIPLIPIFCVFFVDWKLCSKSPDKWVIRNSEEKSKYINRKRSATQRQRQTQQAASAKRQTSVSQAPLLLTAWRDLDTAGRDLRNLPPVWWLAPGGETLPPGVNFRWCGKLALFFFCFREGKHILDTLELEQHVLERLEVC